MDPDTDLDLTFQSVSDPDPMVRKLRIQLRIRPLIFLSSSRTKVLKVIKWHSFAEPHHVDTAPAPGKNFVAALAPTIPCRYSKPTFLKSTKVDVRNSTVYFYHFQ
jgi:hypothetical protein